MLMANVKKAAPGIVQKNSVRLPVAGDDIKWHGDINRVRARIVRVSVGIPHDIIIAAEFPAALVEPSVFFAETINVFVVAELTGNLKRAVAGKRNSILRIGGVENFTGGISKRNSQRR